MSAPEAPGRGPYVGLVPFEAQDAAYFFGRAAFSEVIADHVMARPMTVLFGASGVGKTSVINVGLPAALKEIEIDAVIVAPRRRWDEADELEWVGKLNEQADSIGRQDEPGARMNPGKPWIVILDQFEEFLLHADEPRAKRFAKALARFVARRDVEIHLLFSLRDYGLHRLKSIRSELPHLLETTLELRHLDEAGVREAIERPLAEWNAKHGTGIAAENDFATTLIEQLGTVDLLGKPVRGGAIELSYLQLVLERIWDYERKAGSGKLRTDTLVKRLKGVRGIAREHVDEVLAQLSQQDQALCPTLVDRLVTPSGGKVLYAATDLARVAKVAPGRMEAVAALLSKGRNRLLREVAVPGSTDARGYEIAHDILARPFLDWLADRNRREEARRRNTRRAVEILVVLAAVLGWSVWFLDRYEIRHREDHLTERVAQPEEGSDRRLLSSLYLLWERGSDKARRDGLRDLELRGQLRRERSPDRLPDPAVQDLADPRQLPAEKPPAESSILLARMVSGLERGDVLQARQSLDALDALRKKAGEGADSKTRDAWERATREWERWPGASPQFLRPERSKEEALRLLALLARSTENDARPPGPDRPVVYLGRIAGDPDARWAAISDDLTARAWTAQSGLYSVVLAGCEGRALDTALSRDGRLVAAACFDGTVRIWDLQCGHVEVLERDTSVLRAVAFSPDARRLAVAARGGAVRVWHLDAPGASSPSGCAGRGQSKEHALLGGEGGKSPEVSNLAFSSDGQHVVTVSRDHTASVWDASGQGGRNPLAVLRGHADWVTAAAFSPDGRRVVTASYDGTARIWDWDAPKFRGHRAPAPSAASRPGGAPEIAASRVLQGHTAPVYSAEFSPDGRSVVTASGDGTVRVWRGLEGDSRTEPTLLRTDGSTPTSAAFSADGTKVVTAARDGLVRVWPIAGTPQPGSPIDLLSAASADAFVFPVHFEIAWKRINGQPLSVAERKLTDFYRDLFGKADLADDARKSARSRLEDLESEHPGSGHAMAARAAWQSAGESRDRRLITALFRLAPEGGEVPGTSLDAESRALITAYRVAADYAQPSYQSRRGPRDGGEHLLTSVAISRDGQRMATASYAGIVRFWDRRGDGGWTESRAQLEGSLGRLTSVAFSPDGRRVVTASYDKCARVWGWDASGKPQQLFGLQGHDGPVYSAAFSPDGARVVTASRDGSARVWELNADNAAPQTNRDSCRARGAMAPSLMIVKSQALSHEANADDACPAHDHDGPEEDASHHHGGALHSVASAAFSRDGRYVVTGSADACARVWDLKGEEKTRTLHGHKKAIHMVAFGPDDRSVVSTSYDGTARVWRDWKGGSSYVELPGHRGTVYGAAFSPDGARGVTAADDGARVWALIDGKYESRGALRFPAGAGPVYGVAWDPDGKGAPRVATASEDGIARVWEVGERLNADRFATFLNFRVACTLAASFPEIHCGKAGPSGQIADSDRTQDRLLAATYSAMDRPDRLGAQKAYGALRDGYPDTAHAVLAALAIKAGAPAGGPAADASQRAAENEGAAGRRAGLRDRIGTVLAHLRPPRAFAEEPVAYIAMAVLAWPIWLIGLTGVWWFRHGYRRREGTGVVPGPAADPVRRAWAGVIDLALAVGLGLALGATAGMLAALAAEAAGGFEWYARSLGHRGWELDLAIVVFAGVSCGYLLLRDAVRYRFRRSIGKIAFGLLPVSAAEAETGPGDSARRNLLPVLVYGLVLLPCVAVIIWPHWRTLPLDLQPMVVHVSESFLIAPWKLLGVSGFAAAVIGLTVLGLVDQWLTCVGDGRTLHDRFAGTRVVGLWTQGQEAGADGEAPGGTEPAIARAVP